MSDANYEELSAEIISAIEDYHKRWPVPYALAPNLDLASRALAALASERGELANAQTTLMRVRSWAVEAAFNGEASGDDILAILNSAAANELLPVNNEPYRTRGGRIPTQEERDEVREILAKNKRDESNSRSVEIDLDGLTTELFERSHEPSFEDSASGRQEARELAQNLIDTYVEIHSDTSENYGELAQRAESGELPVKPETVLLTNATDEEITALGGLDHVSSFAENEREKQAQHEAEAYAPGDDEAQDDFLTGWRTADRTRNTQGL